MPPYKFLCLKSYHDRRRKQRGHDVLDFSFLKQKLNQHYTFFKDLITIRECTLKSAGVQHYTFVKDLITIRECTLKSAGVQLTSSRVQHCLSLVAWFLY